MTDKEDDDAILNLLHPAPENGKKSDKDGFSVDSLGIPILDDVVEKPPEVQPAMAPGEAFPTAGGQEPPDYETLLAAMREYLKSQLEDDLSRIVDQVVPTAIANATRDLQANMERELRQLMEQKLALLTEQLLDRQLGKHDPDLD